MTDNPDEFPPDPAEQLEQQDPEQSLVDRGVDDPLDEGYIAPDHWSAGEGFGNTAAEMREGETLEMRIKQELPDVGEGDDLIPDEDERRAPGSEEADEFVDDDEVGDARAGRLVDTDGGYGDVDTESELLAEDVGIDGAAATAEEAAMHVVDESPTEAD